MTGNKKNYTQSRGGFLQLIGFSMRQNVSDEENEKEKNYPE